MEKQADKTISNYMSKIGRKGGHKSKRIISSEAQARMQAGRKNWHDIEGYKGIYQITTDGNVRSLDKVVNCYPSTKRTCKGKILKPLTDAYGYHYFQLSDSNNQIKNKKLHRLLCLAFLPNPMKYPHVNHKNGVKDDNRLKNLEWCTHQQNMKHAYDNGFIPEPITIKGEKSNFAKLTKEQAHQIKVRLKAGEHPNIISKDYPVGVSAIKEIKAGRSWNELTC